jgi:hypothetical protein
MIDQLGQRKGSCEMEATSVLPRIWCRRVFLLGPVGDDVPVLFYVKLIPRNQVRLGIGRDTVSLREEMLLQEKLHDSSGSFARWCVSLVVCSDSNAIAVKLQIRLRLELKIVCPEDDLPPHSSISRPWWVCLAMLRFLHFNGGFIFDCFDHLIEFGTRTIALSAALMSLVARYRKRLKHTTCLKTSTFNGTPLPRPRPLPPP